MREPAERLLEKSGRETVRGWRSLQELPLDDLQRRPFRDLGTAVGPLPFVRPFFHHPLVDVAVVSWT